MSALTRLNDNDRRVLTVLSVLHQGGQEVNRAMVRRNTDLTLATVERHLRRLTAAGFLNRARTRIGTVLDFGCPLDGGHVAVTVDDSFGECLAKGCTWTDTSLAERANAQRVAVANARYYLETRRPAKALAVLEEAAPSIYPQGVPA